MEVPGPGPSGDALRLALDSMGPGSSNVSSCMSSDSSFICSGMLPPETELRLRKMFKQCDLSGCGGFNECELIMSCQRSKDIANFFGLPQRVYKEDGSLEMLAKIFQAIDSNEDHEISWEEFCGFFAKRILAVMAMGQASSYGSSQCTSSRGNSGNSGSSLRTIPYDNPYAEDARNEELLAGSAREYDLDGQTDEPVVETRGHSLATRETRRDHEGTCLASNKCQDCGARLGLVFGMHGFGSVRRRHAAVCTARRTRTTSIGSRQSVTSRASRVVSAGGIRSASLPSSTSGGRNTSASSVKSLGSRKGTPAQPQVGGTMSSPRGPAKGLMMSNTEDSITEAVATDATGSQMSQVRSQAQATNVPDEDENSLRLSEILLRGDQSGDPEAAGSSHGGSPEHTPRSHVGQPDSGPEGRQQARSPNVRQEAGEPDSGPEVTPETPSRPESYQPESACGERPARTSSTIPFG